MTRCGTWFTVLVVGTAPICAQASEARRAIAREEIRSLLQRLDEALAHRDVREYGAAFAPDHPGAHAIRMKQLEQLFVDGTRVTQESTIAGDPRTVGDRTIVRVEHRIRAEGCKNAPADKPAEHFREDTILVVRRDAAGNVVPTLEVEVPTDGHATTNDVLRCPPCNYEFGGAPGWLCVPALSERAPALEAATFYFVGTDLACDVSVQFDSKNRTAIEMARHLGESLRKRENTAKLLDVTAWLPPAHRQEPPAGLEGARLELSIGAEQAVLFVVTFGALHHTLFVRGLETSMRQRTKNVQDLLATYRVLDTNADRAKAIATAFLAHTGGVVTGQAYHNERYGISLTGPDGWQVQQRSGSSLFRVVWESPRGSRLYLSGFGSPRRLGAWCPLSADDWVHNLCDANDLRLGEDAATAWVEHKCGGRSRTYVCPPRGADAPNGPQREIFVLVQEDLLLVVDRIIAAADDADVLERAAKSLHVR